MTEEYDLVVIGTGVAGSTVATECRKRGRSVAIIDSRPFGGTCALRGCDAKKILVSAAAAVDRARKLAGKGVGGDLRIAWPELMQFKRSFTDPVPDERLESYREAGIATYRGRARFVGSRSIEVSGDGESHRLEARRVHIATGARPADLPIAGAEHLTSSDDFLEQGELPPRIVFLGSGYVSFELAHIARIAGAEVVMLEMQERPLAGFESDVVALLVERTRAMGIDLRLETQVEAVEPRADGLRVRATAADGSRLELDTNLVVHGAGRVPDIDDLGLDEAGVEYDESGILVNEYMQSDSNPAVYAAGDAAGGIPLTPVASLEARVATANLLEGNHRSIEYPLIPTVVFTLPPLAAVGLRAKEAQQQGREINVNSERTSGWYSSRHLGEEVSGYKVIVEKGSGKILGAHVFGPGAEELINVFTMAMRCGLTGRDIKKMAFAYPTLASDLAHMV
jgi:glutathione reductase (NADPH)